MNIQIEKLSDDKLSREVWDFYSFDDYSLFKLNYYSHQTRKTKRQIWRTQRCFDSSRPHDTFSEKKEDILTDELIAEARELILQKTIEKIQKTMKFKS